MAIKAVPRHPPGLTTKSHKLGIVPSSHNRPPEEQVVMAERRARALELRKAGHTYRSIASLTGVNVRTAFDDVQSEVLALRQQTTEDADAVRDIELQRLDTMLSALEEGITAGDPMAINAALRVMERRARLMGLDAPEKHAFVGALVTAEQIASMTDNEIEARVTALYAQVKGLGAQSTSGEPEGTAAEDMIEAANDE